MAATTATKLIQARPNHHPLSTFRLLSSSTSTPPPPPDTDNVKATLEQSQSQQQMNPLFRPLAPNPSLSPPPKPLNLDEIGESLRGFRHRTDEKPFTPRLYFNSVIKPIGKNAKLNNSVSFQGILQTSGVDSSSQGGDEKPKTPNFNSIRESLSKIKLSVNNPKLNKSMSEYQQSFKQMPLSNGGIDSSNTVNDPLPFSVFGKEMGNEEDDSPAMKTEFVRFYSVQELGDKLKSLRPEKKKGDDNDWFSLNELNERLAKLRQMEVEAHTANVLDNKNEPKKQINHLKFFLSKMSLTELDKVKKESMQRLETRDILSMPGRTPSFMLEPPKQELVEKYFHPDNMSASEKLKLELQKVRDEFKMSETDCGSARVQVAQLTTKIKHLATVLHKKDKHSRRGLKGMLAKRKSLLKYLRRTDWESYSFVLSKLGLRDNPEIKRY